MGKTTSSRIPLLFESKLLCFSLLYLFTILFLALHKSLSTRKCVLNSSPFEPVQTPLLSYPSSYGEHKYALPARRSSCSFPVFFSDYRVVFREIQDLCGKSSVFTPVLRYMQGNADSFAGNFSTQRRISYFHHRNDSVEVASGFFKKFPISDSG